MYTGPRYTHNMHVVNPTAAKIKPCVFSVTGFDLSYVAIICISTICITYDC
jgi:hypothetical protein